jgi:hypothetical protein
MRDFDDDGSGIPYLRFEPDAIERFLAFREPLESEDRRDDLPPALIAHLSKFRGPIARLALVCHLASGGYGRVSGEAVEKAIGSAAYLEAHARRAYGSLSVDSSEAARAIWRRVEKGDLADGFTERGIYNKCWANLQKGRRFTDGLNMLVECGWLVPQTKATAGRPTTIYRINPKALAPQLKAA